MASFFIFFVLAGGSDIMIHIATLAALVAVILLLLYYFGPYSGQGGPNNRKDRASPARAPTGTHREDFADKAAKTEFMEYWRKNRRGGSYTEFAAQDPSLTIIDYHDLAVN